MLQLLFNNKEKSYLPTPAPKIVYITKITQTGVQSAEPHTCFTWNIGDVCNRAGAAALIAPLARYSTQSHLYPTTAANTGI